jgi:sulfur-oxidizing protein SoxY
MNRLRRSLISVLGIALLKPWAVFAAVWNKEAFGAKSAAEALKGIGAAAATASSDILIDVPQIAENGAVVPIEITSNIAGTKSISVLVDKNPFPLIAKFDFMEGALPFVKVNVKMGETSEVRVIAEAAGRHYVASKEVKVTIGGCGG